MWHERLKYLPDQHKWLMGAGAILTVAGVAWYISAMASPTVGPHNRLYKGPSGGASAKPAARQAAAPAAPPVPLQTFEQLTPAEAQAENASIPFSALPNPAAKPFRLQAASALDRARALTCLTMAVYYEAGSQGADGEAAVAQVVLNRLRNPLFPKTVCGVVLEGADLPTGCQFTFTCDGSLGRRPSQSGWKQAQAVAERALDGYVQKSVGEATHYHTVWVVPYWQPSVVKLTRIGAHIFYRWPGGLGQPAAFLGQYAGTEPAPPAIKGFDTGLPTAEVAQIDTMAPPPPVKAAVAPPAPPVAITAQAHGVEVAALTVGPPAVVDDDAPRQRPKGYFGGGEGGAQRLPVPSQW